MTIDQAQVQSFDMLGLRIKTGFENDNDWFIFFNIFRKHSKNKENFMMKTLVHIVHPSIE